MYRVFIVDDEPQVIRGLSTQIDWESYNMELAGTATNGQDVLDAIAHSTIHLLIADVCMPQMDGISLISKAKRLNPSLRCIMISAYSEFDYVKQSFQLGVENYLLKPINKVELHDTLSKTLENLDLHQWEYTTESPDLLSFRTNILDRWVNGNIQEFELYERADLLDMDLSASEYSVSVIEIIDSGDFKNKVTCSSVLLEMCRKSLFPNLRAECFIDKSSRVTIIILEEPLRKARKHLSSLLEQIGSEVKPKGVRIFTSIGYGVCSSSDVSDSYMASLLHLNYRFVNPSSEIFICDNRLKSSGQCISGEFQRMLLNFDHLMQERNADQAVFLVEKFLERFSTTPIESLKGIMLPLVLHLIRLMFESGGISDTLSVDTLDRFSEFPHIQSVETLETWLPKMIHISMQVIRERKGSFSFWVQRILQEIHQNYQTELSLKTISTKLNVSSAYLGQLFKEETGKYFNDVLIEIRMHASRTLLLESNMKINEVSSRVGIPNQSYFNRVFKKKFGLTPVEFRRSSAFYDEINS